MKPIIAIRTHRWGDEEERLAAHLAQVPGHALAVVFHNRPDGVKPPIDTIDISEAWLATQGLRALPNWGWRCGDYFYYALRALRPDHGHYWLIEPDVHVDGQAARFFEAFAGVEDDALGYAIAPFTQNIAFAKGLPGMALYRAIFALTRLSGRAIDRLFALRRAYSASNVSARHFTNDEIFIFTHVAADPALTMRSLEGIAPALFEATQFAPDPDILYDLQRQSDTGAGRLVHPVRGREGYKRALVARLAGGNIFLRNTRASLRTLSEADIDEVADLAAAQIRAELRAWRGGR